MKNFHNVNLPAFVALHASGGPLFATTIASTASGREARIADRSSSFQRYLIANCKLSAQQFEEFNGFFRSRLGQQYSFRIRDYADCTIQEQVIASHPHPESIEVYKSYLDPLKSYNRRITKLVEGSVQIKVNDRELAGAQIDYERGLIKLQAPLSPEESLIITAMFDVEVRFGSDNFTYSTQSDGSIMIEDLVLVEVAQ